MIPRKEFFAIKKYMKSIVQSRSGTVKRFNWLFTRVLFFVKNPIPRRIKLM